MADRGGLEVSKIISHSTCISIVVLTMLHQILQSAADSR